ncbi:MAG: hypothetical protein HOP30_16535, partial [Cyclobacteriaceae bacterium]|nr:hypothetical protein [Cyclobacteriaceae bacterium]
MGRDQAWSHGGATGDLSPEAMASQLYGAESYGKWQLKKETTYYRVTYYCASCENDSGGRGYTYYKIESEEEYYYTYVMNDEQTQGDPEDYKEINYYFSTDFNRHFGVLQGMPNPTVDKIISRVWDQQGAVLSREDKKYQMRPLYFTLEGPGITGTITQNLIDPKEWTLEPIWGNPGTIRSGPSQTGIPTPMTIPFDGSFYLTLYFQKVPVIF